MLTNVVEFQYETQVFHISSENIDHIRMMQQANCMEQVRHLLDLQVDIIDR